MEKIFKIYVSWKADKIALDCEMLYESSQIQRIKISKSGKSFTLENNYPFTKIAPSNKRPALKWKIKEGNPSDARFLTEVMEKLEDYIKDKKPFDPKDLPKNNPYNKNN